MKQRVVKRSRLLIAGFVCASSGDELGLEGLVGVDNEEKSSVEEDHSLANYIGVNIGRISYLFQKMLRLLLLK